MKIKIPLTVPNVLTTIRLLAIPFMAVFIHASEKPGGSGHFYNVLAFCFFVGIWITDAADGFIARRFNQVSEFGKIYDPFVDKLFQFTTALMLFLNGRLPLWVVVFIVLKEAVMIAGGAYLLRKRRIVVHTKWYGKLSTVLFVLSLAAVFLLPFFADPQVTSVEALRSITNIIFIPPVLMSSFATICYGVTMIQDSSKLADSDTEEHEKYNGTRV